jgi:hypothetical protein
VTNSSTLARAWSAFVRWERGRPFWGGLFLVLSGLEFYVSAHMDLMPVKVSFGSQGFLSWVIPLGLLLCGLLVWLTPAQRIFYGILGATVSVAALIGLNLGGFFVGMLLGIVGGALSFSWTPGTPAADETAELPVYRDDQGIESAEDPGPDVAGEAEGEERPGGPLSDDLPTSTTSPLGVPPVQGGRHASPDQPPGGTSGRLLAVVLVSALATAGLLGLPDPPPAAAAPCPASTGAAPKATTPKATPPKTSGPTAQPGAASPKAQAAAPSTPTTSPSPTGGGDPIGDAVSGFFDSVGRLLGIGGSATPSPSATPTRSPSPAPTPGRTTAAPKPTGSARPSAKPSGSPTPSACAGAGSRKLAVPAGQPLVNERPSKQIAALLTQSGLSYDGIVDLPTHSGTIRVLQFSMDSSASTPFELQVPGPLARTISLRSSKLTVSGHVRFFTTEIKGNLLGVAPVTFTPDSPPPLVLPELFFTSATVQLVFVQSDLLTAPNLNTSYL